MTDPIDLDAIGMGVNRLIYNDQSGLLDGVLNYYPLLVERQDLNGRTWMHHAAESGSWGCMDVLRKHGLEIDTPDVSGQTPLHRAAARFHHDAVSWLLANGANPNAKNAFGATPTLYAAEWSADGVEAMIVGGGDASVRDHSGDGVEQWASRGAFMDRLKAQRDAANPATAPSLKR